MTQADAGISLPDHEICPAETKLVACEEEVSKDRLLPVKPDTDPYPNCERECGGLGQPCLCRIEDPQSSDGGVDSNKEMSDWLKTFPKIPWYFLAWCWVKNLLPRCSAKSAGLQCCLRFPHFGPHHADWRVWDRKGVYRDRIGRLEEEVPK